MADDLPFKVGRVDADGHLEVLGLAINVSIARGAYDKAVRMYTKDHIELREGARIVASSKASASASARED
jgi:hypothetical protein